MTGTPIEYGRNPSVLDDPERTTTKPTDDEEAPYDGDDLLKLAQSNPEKAAKKILALWDEAKKHPTQQKREAQWKANALRRLGIPNVRLQKAKDESVYTVWVPPGAAQAAPVVNFAATLCRKITANLFADPPAPMVIPSSGEDQDRDSAELAERILADLASESGLDDIRGARNAFDRAHTYASGFVWYDIDPAGNGEGPQAILASAMAQTVDDALLPGPPYVLRYVTEEQDFQPPAPPPQEQVTGVDPMGQPMVTMVPGTPPLKRRARLLTDDPEKAARVPLPKLRKEILTGKHVLMQPVTAQDIWEAEGVMKGMFLPFSTLKRQFKELADLPPDEQKKLFEKVPAKTEGMYPAGMKGRDQEQGDNRLAFTICYVCKAGGTMPQGAYLIVVGDRIVHSQAWMAPRGQSTVPLDLPVTQYKVWEEGREDPLGVATMEILGPGNEVRIAQMGGLMTHLDRFNNRKIFYPSNSMLQPKQMQLATGTYIPMNPGGGAPVPETIPPYPKESIEVFTITGEEMGNSVSMSAVAQGLDSPDVQSGRHAYQVVAQAHAGLSEPKQNVERGYTRGCRIQLQLIGAFYTKYQRVRWSTEDGQYREKWFLGSDLGSATDVRIKPGTMTMMTPTAKMALAMEWNQGIPGLLSIEQLQKSLYSGAGVTIGVQDDPARLRIRRQLSEWQDGPPEDGNLVGRAQQIFPPFPSDLLPTVAQVRVTEIVQFSQGVKYERQPLEWRQFLDLELQRMQFAIMPPAVPGQPAGPGGSGAPNQPPPEEAVSGTPQNVDPANPPLDNPVLSGA